MPSAKKGLVDYISRNLYQPAKINSKYDEEFLVATLSRIHTDAKLLQQEKNFSAVTHDNFYHDNKPDLQASSTQHTKQLLKINFAMPKLLKKDNMSLAPHSPSSKLPLEHSPNFIGDPATRVRLSNNNSTFAKQRPNQNYTPINCTKFDSTPAPQVHLTQNQLTPAQQVDTLKSNTPNHNISDCDLDPRVRFTHNKLTLAGHNSILFNQ